jgi:hypothetical protein
MVIKCKPITRKRLKTVVELLEQQRAAGETWQHGAVAWTEHLREPVHLAAQRWSCAGLPPPTLVIR